MVRITVSGVLRRISFQNLNEEVRCRTANYVKIRKNNTLLINSFINNNVHDIKHNLTYLLTYSMVQSPF